MKKALLDTNIWVALGPSSLVCFFTLDARLELVAFLFFATLFLYNFARINRIPFYFMDDSVENIHKVFAALGFFAALYFARTLISTHFFACMLLFGVPSILYSLPSNKLGLRSIPFIKLFVIAFVWSGMIWVFPSGEILKSLMEWEFYVLFFFTVGITLPFDIRDVRRDSLELKTIPQVMSIYYAQLVAVACLVFSALLFFFTVKGLAIESYIWILSCLIGVLFVIKAPKNIKSRWYFEGFGEGIAIIPIILLNLYLHFW